MLIKKTVINCKNMKLSVLISCIFDRKSRYGGKVRKHTKRVLLRHLMFRHTWYQVKEGRGAQSLSCSPLPLPRLLSRTWREKTRALQLHRKNKRNSPVLVSPRPPSSQVYHAKSAQHSCVQFCIILSLTKCGTKFCVTKAILQFIKLYKIS